MMKLEEKRRILVLFLFLFLSSLYLFKKPSLRKVDSEQENSPSFKVKKTYTACDKVDIPWLAGDRIYWNGREPKAMFMKADGTFTKGNVYITEGDEICIVVLLESTPAYSSPQFETEHVGYTDSISLFAQGKHTRQTIRLKQHAIQANAYYASVQFRHQDTYQLAAIEEYRSYFWETPMTHTYHPTLFTSQNKLVVKGGSNNTWPMCQFNDTRLDLSGAWVDPSIYAERHREALYTMFESSHLEHLENNKVFIPNACLLEFKSTGYGSRCLGTKTVHVWGDNNLRRNLKAFHFNARQWCDMAAIESITDEDERREASRCICNDDHEDESLYPWIQDPYTPITLDNAWGINAHIYYHRVSGRLEHPQLIDTMKTFVTDVQPADYVILGLGNDDIQALRDSSPRAFQAQFTKLLLHIRHVYPSQPLIIRTPQFFCCGVVPATAWNSERSRTFADIVRDAVRKEENMMVWDTHVLGTDENTCLDQGSTYTRRNVIHMENLILWNLICQ